MTSTQYPTSSQDGYVNGNSGVGVAAFPSAVNIFVFTSSSSNANEDQGFWFHPIGLPGSEVLNSASWSGYVNSVTDDGIAQLEIWIDPTLAAGTTLQASDFGLGHNTRIYLGAMLLVGWATFTVPTGSINKSSTNATADCSAASSTTCQNTFDASENVSGRAAYITLDHNPPATGSPSTLMTMGVA